MKTKTLNRFVCSLGLTMLAGGGGVISGSAFAATERPAPRAEHEEGPHAHVLATGQTKCRDSNGTLISCRGTGQDGDFRAGAKLFYVSRPNGTIEDMNTGLSWEKKTATCGGDIHCVTEEYSWEDAFSTFIRVLNTEPCFADHCDWRLPNVRELNSIVNYGNAIPAVSHVFNDCTNGSCTYPSFYWSSSSYVTATGSPSAWDVCLGHGYIHASPKNVFNQVRAVRGGL